MVSLYISYSVLCFKSYGDCHKYEKGKTKSTLTPSPKISKKNVKVPRKYSINLHPQWVTLRYDNEFWGVKKTGTKCMRSVDAWGKGKITMTDFPDHQKKKNTINKRKVKDTLVLCPGCKIDIGGKATNTALSLCPCTQAFRTWTGINCNTARH